MCLRRVVGVASIPNLPPSTTELPTGYATMHPRHRRGQMVGLLVLFSEPNGCVDVDTLAVFFNTLFLFQQKLTDFLLHNNECSL